MSDERSFKQRNGVFLERLLEENRRARKKFPSNEKLQCALSEEVGELAKALFEEPFENVYAEAVQVASVAMRIAVEGDASLGRNPEEERLVAQVESVRESIGEGLPCNASGAGDPPKGT